MMWTAWRQQRSIFVVFCAITALLIVVLLVSGFHTDSLWKQLLARPCKGGFPRRHLLFCEGQWNQVQAAVRFNAEQAFAMTVVGPLFGVVLGVNAVARDLDRRTARLAWTQSGTRAQWLTSKFALNGGLLAALMIPLCFVATWWNRAEHYQARIDLDGLPLSGFTLFLVSIFAFAVVVMLGLFIRRSGWTLAAAIALVAVSFSYIEYEVRPNLVGSSFVVIGGASIEEGSSSGVYGDNGVPSNAWQRATGVVPKGTKTTPSTSELSHYMQKLEACQVIQFRKAAKNVTGICLKSVGVEQVALYVPDSQFWTVQIRDGSIYVGFSILFAGVSYFTVRRMLA
jgi:ABC-type transport system involved in multi-copper enzyme maturation permease subunit